MRVLQPSEKLRNAVDLVIVTTVRKRQAVRIDEFAHALSLKPSSLLRVSCSASLAMSVVAPALVELKKKLPGLTVSWQTTLMADMPKEVLSKEAEVAVAVL